MGHRQQRLTEAFREEVAKIISEDLKDPRIGFVTVTRVEMTGDLRQAKVYVGVLGTSGGPGKDRSLNGLRQGAGFIRRLLGQRLRLRHTPELTFVYDRGLDHADRVAQLLDSVKEEEGSAAGAEAAGQDPESKEPDQE